MAAAAAAARRIREPAGPGACQRDQRLHRVGLDRRMHHQHVGHVGHQRHWREVANRVVADGRIQPRIHRVRRQRAHQQRVAIARRARDQLCTEAAAGAGTVVDQHRLAEALGQPGPDQPGADVEWTARRERDDEADGLRRPGGRHRCCCGGHGRYRSRGERRRCRQHCRAQRIRRHRSDRRRGHPSPGTHCAVMPACLISFAQRSYSSPMNLRNCSGVLAMVSSPASL